MVSRSAGARSYRLRMKIGVVMPISERFHELVYGGTLIGLGLGSPLLGVAAETLGVAVRNAPVTRNETLIIGESHGTAEAPAFTLALIDQLSREGPVVFGVELSPDSTALPCGGAGAALPASWKKDRADGRTSIAMHDLVCGAQKLAKRRRITVVFLDDRSSGKPFDTNAASKFVDVLKATPNAAGVILTGNFHARNSPGSLTANIRALGVQVVSATQSTGFAGSTAWQCTTAGCGAGPISLQFCGGSGSSAPIKWMSNADGRWDKCLSFPRLSASPPFDGP